MPAFTNANPVGNTVGFPGNFGNHIQNAWSNQQGDKLVVNPTAGNALVVFVFGLRDYDPFDRLHGASPNLGYLSGLNDYNAAPTITDSGSVNYAITATASGSSAVATINNVAVTTNVATYTTTAAHNFVAGEILTIAGLTHTALNGTGLVIASVTATTFNVNIVTANVASVADSGTATPTSNIVVTAANHLLSGQQVTISGTGEAFLNGQTLTVSANGLSPTQFTALLASYTGVAVTNGAEPAPATAKEIGGNQWVTVTPISHVTVQDYTVVSTPPPAPNPFPSVKWGLDGNLPGIYCFYATNVNAGPYTITVNSMYQSGLTRPQSYSGGGLPLFDDGVDIHVFEFASVLTAAAGDGSSSGVSAANPAVVPAITTTANGDLLLTAGYMKSGNAFSSLTPAGTTNTAILAQGKAVASQGHWVIQGQLQTTLGAIQPGFTNPLGYELTLLSLALKHS